jgi:hypothetical protein
VLLLNECLFFVAVYFVIDSVRKLFGYTIVIQKLTYWYRANKQNQHDGALRNKLFLRVFLLIQIYITMENVPNPSYEYLIWLDTGLTGTNV